MMSIFTKVIATVAFFALFTMCSNVYRAPHRTAQFKAPDSLQLPDTIPAINYYRKDFLKYRDAVYQPTIKTVQLYKKGVKLSKPIVTLSGNDQLLLTFDDLKKEPRDYIYTITHCNADWRPSYLISEEYLKGYRKGQIQNYQHSRQTDLPYIHYRLTLPNQEIQFKKSGNYLLKVFTDTSPRQLVLTKRFMIVKQKAAIDAELVQPDQPKHQYTSHALEFTVALGDYQVGNVYEDVTVTLLQNDRWDNAITGLKPSYTRDGELIYNDREKTRFEGGKEFRPFDTRSVAAKSQAIRSIREDSLTHVYLKTDDPQSYKQYYNIQDINGQYLIESSSSSMNANYAADYQYVHFTLSFPTPVKNGSLYVFGALTQWDLLPKAQLHFNPKGNTYQTKLLLKQGYYNYQYIFAQDGTDVFDTGLVEGNAYETENNYTILVYARQPGQNHDALIGVTHLNSKHLQKN